MASSARLSAPSRRFLNGGTGRHRPPGRPPHGRRRPGGFRLAGPGEVLGGGRGCRKQPAGPLSFTVPSCGAVPGRLPERPKGAVCKTVGFAFPGSNPGPATTCGNGPWPGVSRDLRAGAFGSVGSRHIHRSPAVYSCARTYSGQRPARISGPPGPPTRCPVVQVPRGASASPRSLLRGYPSAKPVTALMAQISGSYDADQVTARAYALGPKGAAAPGSPRSTRAPTRSSAW